MSGDGWRRVSAIVDSGSAECVAPESIAKNIPLVEIEASRQGQTYHTADGVVIKNEGEKTRCGPDHTTPSGVCVTKETMCRSHRQEVGSSIMRLV